MWNCTAARYLSEPAERAMRCVTSTVRSPHTRAPSRSATWIRSCLSGMPVKLKTTCWSGACATKSACVCARAVVVTRVFRKCASSSASGSCVRFDGGAGRSLTCGILMDRWLLCHRFVLCMARTQASCQVEQALFSPPAPRRRCRMCVVGRRRHDTRRTSRGPTYLVLYVAGGSMVG